MKTPFAGEKLIQFDPSSRELSAKAGSFRFLADLAPKKLWLAIGLLVVGLLVTLVLSLYIKQEVETAARNNFDFVCNEIQLNINDRLNSHALMLYSSSALFYASQEVSRSEWHIFTSKLRIEQEMPGTQGIGFSIVISPDQLVQHIQTIRAEGFSDYVVWPEGEREIYTAIVYLEPFSGRNLRAFGYDMFSEPIRRAAMERARDENSAALSGKVKLVQETDEDIQAGALMYAPVYRNNAPVSTVAERRAAIIGWVYSPFRMKNLMDGTLGNYQLKQDERHIVLQIYDGEAVSEETLLYDSRQDDVFSTNFTNRDISKTRRVIFFGQPWTLQFTQVGGLSSSADYDSLWLVVISGISISLLLFGLIISLLRTEHYLESIRLLAETDSLTGVNSRRKIIEMAESEFVRAKRQQHDLTILMIDLNFFKSINDNFGHMMGDHALCRTAEAIHKTLRKDIDQLGRFGGDEFLVVLPETNLVQARVVIARLRENVTDQSRDLANGLSPISLSIGAAELEETTHSLGEMIDRADRAMYADKKLAKAVRMYEV